MNMPELIWYASNQPMEVADRKYVEKGGGMHVSECCGSRYVENVLDLPSTSHGSRGVMLALSAQPIEHTVTDTYQIDCVKVGDTYIHLKLNIDTDVTKEEDDDYDD